MPARSHVGISFRVHGDSAERFYIRPDNARPDDQLFRNLKNGLGRGRIALWTRISSDAYFSNLRIVAR